MIDEQLEEFMLRVHKVIDKLIPVLETQDHATAWYAMMTLVNSSAINMFDDKQRYIDIVSTSYDMIAESKRAMDNPALREVIETKRREYEELLKDVDL